MASQQRHRLQPVAAGPGTRLLHHPPPIDGVLHAGHHQTHPQLRHPPVPVVDDLGEVVPRVHVHHRERQPGGGERLHRQVQHDRGVLAPREQHHRALELGRHLPDDVHRLGLERLQMRQLVGPRRPGRCGAGQVGGRHGPPRLNPTYLVSNSDRSGKKSNVTPATLDDHALAARLATEAGALLVDLRARAVAAAEATGRPLDGKALGRAGDRQAHDLLMAGLADGPPPRRRAVRGGRGRPRPPRRRTGVDRRPARRHPRVRRGAAGGLGGPRRVGDRRRPRRRGRGAARPGRDARHPAAPLPRRRRGPGRRGWSSAAAARPPRQR